MHIYVFGSICRGELDKNSDVDLLALTESHDALLSQEMFSIYSYDRIKFLWKQGNPFAWHLRLESKLIFSPDKSDFLAELGDPSEYEAYNDDFSKFYNLFRSSRDSLILENECRVFDLSSIFLSIRNIATCFSLAALNSPVFSRSSAMNIGKHSICIDPNAYRVLERARILCTRGTGEKITENEFSLVMSCLQDIEDWMLNVLKLESTRERV